MREIATHTPADVAAVLAGMDVDTKIALTQAAQPAVPALGLPACELSLAAAGDPSALAVGSTWNPELARELGEHRAADAGPMTLAPVRRPVLDPRAPGAGTAFGEDPLLCSMLGTAYTEGLTSGDTTLAVVRKGVDGLRCVARAGFNMRLLNEVEWPVQRAAVEAGGALGVTLPQALFDDHPSVARRMIANIYRAWSAEEILILCETAWPGGDWVTALRLGADGFLGPIDATAGIRAAFDRGELPEDVLTAAAGRMLRARCRLTSARRHVSAEERAAVLLEAARESVVLLRNDGLLPLLAGPGVRLAVLGHTGENLARALSGAADVMRHDGEDLDKAARVARAADVAVVTVGRRSRADRTTLSLGDAEQRLVRAVRAANPNTVLVITSTHPYALDWEDAYVPAILWTAQDGPHAAAALAAVLLGEDAPTGRLPQTWYRTLDELPAEIDGDVIASDMTYLFHRDALYPFGHGLTYTTFEHGPVELSDQVIDADGATTVTVEVRNTGFRDGEEVVQVYTRFLDSRIRQPLRQLRGFRRVRVPAGGSTRVSFSLPAGDLAFWDVSTERWVIESARHEVFTAASGGALLTVRGTAIAPRVLAGRTLDARRFDEGSGIRLVTLPGDEDSVITAVRAGGWAAYRGYDLTGCRLCELTVSAGQSALVELRAHAPDGPLLGAARVEPGGATPVRMPLRQLEETLDVYLVFAEPGAEVTALAFL
ncbi:glycoside hydrolase family 3 C-terminal domain-containing protein [Kutzneria buriramensis]|uniref:Beta-glucosidase-like glycosyl hydrolase n=1 Tax=Kutzneria buriramensis TaxID=1045776 RepID=A0A3E0HI27_9PSEU|nr:glycoside hydrolase family 3 C-terminal domain-containing protein [Kutzneria buriramensis]REH46042.1 beta-glucosidase-like glycosyl hydrolase [Kutzneria buriramensis]